MTHAIVIGSVPVMHYRPLVGRAIGRIDTDTGELSRQEVQELLDKGTAVRRAYVLALKQADLDPAEIRSVFWSWRALQTVAEPHRAALQDDPFPAVFSFTEEGEAGHIHPTSIFTGAVHYVTSRDRKTVEVVRWASLPF